MQHARDDAFCHLIARRSVARAALHLGVECMSQEALDALASITSTYLERFGQALSNTVESSGRTSAHANAMDALRAVELVTSPAVTRVHYGGNNTATVGDDTVTTNGVTSSTTTNWKGLAAFVFGIDWSDDVDVNDDPTADGSHATATTRDTLQMSSTGAGGKVGPRASSHCIKNGWCAPYPDELPDFPAGSSNNTANHHRMIVSDKLAESLHGPIHDTTGTMDANKEMETDLQNMPDAVFTKEWGATLDKSETMQLDDTTTVKRKANSDDHDASDKPAKKQKLNNGLAALERPEYIPNFLPPYPRAADSIARTIVELESAPDKAKQTLEPSVKNVSHDSSYWGSTVASGNETQRDAHVPKGRSTTLPLASSGPMVSQVVVPLGRASGSRVSRILEGSMDPAV
jgi:hypothetical protein